MAPVENVCKDAILKFYVLIWPVRRCKLSIIARCKSDTHSFVLAITRTGLPRHDLDSGRDFAIGMAEMLEVDKSRVKSHRVLNDSGLKKAISLDYWCDPQMLRICFASATTRDLALPPKRSTWSEPSAEEAATIAAHHRQLGRKEENWALRAVISTGWRAPSVGCAAFAWCCLWSQAD